jgi:hypothetical protein
MLFELNGERRVFGDFLQNLYFRDADFVAAGGALLSSNLAGDDDAGLLRQTLERIKRFGSFLLRANALDDASAVAENGEQQFAGFAKIVEPAFQRYFLPVVLSCLFDADRGHSSVLCVGRNRLV